MNELTFSQARSRRRPHRPRKRARPRCAQQRLRAGPSLSVQLSHRAPMNGPRPSGSSTSCKGSFTSPSTHARIRRMANAQNTSLPLKMDCSGLEWGSCLREPALRARDFTMDEEGLRFRPIRGDGRAVWFPRARTPPGWWHTYVMIREVRFLRGRLTFGDALHPAPFPSAIVIFRSPDSVTP